MPPSRKDKSRAGTSTTRSGSQAASPPPVSGESRRSPSRKSRISPENDPESLHEPAPPGPVESQAAAARNLALRAARSLRDDKCTDVLVLDVRGLSNVWDFVVIATGTSDRQMRSAADHVRTLARDLGHGVLRDNADDRCTWVLLDCVDVCVHVFEEATRGYYDLESMFDEAPRLAWDLPEQRPAQRSVSRRG